LRGSELMLRRNKSGTTNAAAQLDNANHAGVVAVIAAMLCGDFCERVLRVAAVFFWGGYYLRNVSVV